MYIMPSLDSANHSKSVPWHEKYPNLASLLGYAFWKRHPKLALALKIAVGVSLSLLMLFIASTGVGLLVQAGLISATMIFFPAVSIFAGLAIKLGMGLIAMAVSTISFGVLGALASSVWTFFSSRALWKLNLNSNLSTSGATSDPELAEQAKHDELADNREARDAPDKQLDATNVIAGHRVTNGQADSISPSQITSEPSTEHSNTSTPVPPSIIPATASQASIVQSADATTTIFGEGVVTRGNVRVVAAAANNSTSRGQGNSSWKNSMLTALMAEFEDEQGDVSKPAIPKRATADKNTDRGNLSWKSSSLTALMAEFESEQGDASRPASPKQETAPKAAAPKPPIPKRATAPKAAAPKPPIPKRATAPKAVAPKPPIPKATVTPPGAAEPNIPAAPPPPPAAESGAPAAPPPPLVSTNGAASQSGQFAARPKVSPKVHPKKSSRTDIVQRARRGGGRR
jgi:hypothetical protein